MTTTFQDATVVTVDRADVHGVIAQSSTDMFILNWLTVGPDFDPGQFRPGQKIRIYFEGLNADDQPKIKSVMTLS